MTIRAFRILVGVGVLVLGLAWVSHDRAIAGSGAAAGQAVVGTAAYDEPQFTARFHKSDKVGSCFRFPWLPWCR